jgi:predicted ribosome quality control (RQC) complex YloA/Tae2 family protein
MATDKPIKIPFDSLALEAIVAELQPYVGGRIQNIRQPDDTTVGLALYAGFGEATFLISCHPEFARAHFVAKRPTNQPQPPTFCATLRARIEGGALRAARQVQGDRILELEFESDEGFHTIVAELMGKHSNIMLVDAQKRVVAATKWVGENKSARPILSGRPYQRPPTFDGKARPSPFLQRLIEAGGTLSLPFSPVFSPGHGAYPISVAALGLTEYPKATLSLALEAHFETAIRDFEAAALRGNLTSQLQRVLLARETALSDLRQALEQGEKAGKTQLLGELVLAYGSSIAEGSSILTAWDYDGNEVIIKLNPELDFKENANRYFDKAKKAKARLGMVRDQIARLQNDATSVRSLQQRVEVELRLDRLREMKVEADSHRWLNNQSPTGAKPKDERPFEGHRVRELLGPGGYKILFGENAEANDYLTLRIAKPADWWLHIRGSQSAHVIVQTRNQPDKVGKDVLLYAAKIAVQNSPSKHSGFVPVDYTLKKYVRRPKGSAKGAVLYTNEKTLHVD